jgi:hypothetical protein
MSPKSQIHTYGVLKKEEMLFMYAPTTKATPPKIQNLLTELNYLDRLLHTTLAPWIVDATACPRYERNLIQYYVEKKPFTIFNYILVEILNISKTPFCSCGYAPHIMMMIEHVTGRQFVKDVFITKIKPQAQTELTFSPDMTSSSTAHTTRSGMAPPPPPVGS